MTLVGALALIAGTVIAVMQPTREEPLRDPSWTSKDWWWYPIERNAVQRLAVSKGPLQAVYARRSSEHVWFAGAGGLVVHSADGGRTWTSTTLSATPQAVKASYPAPSGAKKASIRSRRPTGSAVPVSLVSMQQPYSKQQAPAKTTIVPSVIGLQLASAVGKLKGAQLREGATQYVSSRVAAGQVFRQSPAAGDTVPIGSAVLLTVSGSPSTPQQQRAPDPATATSTDSVASATTFYPSFTGICLTASRIGWVIGDRGAVFRTSDDGATWTQLQTDVTSDLIDLACSDRLGGVAVGEGAVLHLRGDRSAADVRAADGARRQIAIVSDGMLVTVDQLGGGEGGVMRSADTGRTWTADPGLAAISVGPIVFSDSLHGVSPEYSGAFSKTRNGGRTWQSSKGCTFRTVGDTSGISLRRLFASTQSVAIALDDRDRLWRTTDEWTTCAPLGAFHSFAVRLAAASDDVWYAVDGGALRSIDGGRTWHSLINTSRFTSLHFVDSLRGFAGVESGLVARTTNGGRSWTYVRLDSLDSDTPLHFAPRVGQEIYAILDGR